MGCFRGSEARPRERVVDVARVDGDGLERLVDASLVRPPTPGHPRGGGGGFVSRAGRSVRIPATWRRAIRGVSRRERGSAGTDDSRSKTRAAAASADRPRARPAPSFATPPSRRPGRYYCPKMNRRRRYYDASARPFRTTHRPTRRTSTTFARRPTRAARPGWFPPCSCAPPVRPPVRAGFLAPRGSRPRSVGLGAVPKRAKLEGLEVTPAVHEASRGEVREVRGHQRLVMRPVAHGGSPGGRLGQRRRRPRTFSSVGASVGRDAPLRRRAREEGG